jgi:hypothetical protein
MVITGGSGRGTGGPKKKQPGAIRPGRFGEKYEQE